MVVTLLPTYDLFLPLRQPALAFVRCWTYRHGGRRKAVEFHQHNVAAGSFRARIVWTCLISIPLVYGGSPACASVRSLYLPAAVSDNSEKHQELSEATLMECDRVADPDAGLDEPHRKRSVIG